MLGLLEWVEGGRHNHVTRLLRRATIGPQLPVSCRKLTFFAPGRSTGPAVLAAATPSSGTHLPSSVVQLVTSVRGALFCSDDKLFTRNFFPSAETSYDPSAGAMVLTWNSA